MYAPKLKCNIILEFLKHLTVIPLYVLGNSRKHRTLMVILIFSLKNKLDSQITAVRIYMQRQGGIYLTNCI